VNCIALIPARSGSERIPDKNIKPLAGHPLMAYTIAAAKESGVFTRILVSTDSAEYVKVARHYGAAVIWRPPAYATAESPDIDWVAHALLYHPHGEDGFSILRPTSPFRQPETIRRAWAQFCDVQPVDSLRAVEPCMQHPGKMWVLKGQYMVPLLPFSFGDAPWHDNQYKRLPDVLIQNASLEIAWVEMTKRTRTISGSIITPFLTEGYEGCDLHTPDDWLLAEWLVETGRAKLPEVQGEPWTF